MPAPPTDAPIDVTFDDLTRELRLVIDAAGAIVWADARALRAGLEAPGPLARFALAGSDVKLAELCRRAAAGPVHGWEVALALRGEPVTVMLSGKPLGDGRVALAGSLVPQQYVEAVHEGQRAMHELVQLNRELARQKQQLEESSRGIRALHAELEQQADRLRASNEIKTRIVANVSHELRTPLHSILGLSRLLLDNSDGVLNDEQRTQMGFIRSSAEELSSLINDMLDLAKLDAGQAPIRAAPFELAEFLGALRGTMAPLLREGGPVALVFDPVPDVPLETDQGKLAQILRNLISNAIKYTERGTIRVSAQVRDEAVAISVTDTGIGIAREDRDRIFEEFVQIDHPLQARVRGTGLGLPLTRKLAASLGGRLEVDSILGVGSTFTVTLPLEHADVAEYRRLEHASRLRDDTRAPVLVVEDDRSAVFVYERYLSMAGFQVVPARTTADAREALRHLTPSAILLDVMLEGEDTWSFLAELKREPATRDIPVLVCTVMNRAARARALGADELWLKPIDQDKLIRKLQSLSAQGGARVLVVDDEPAARYLIRRYLAATAFQVSEAADGRTAVELARRERPQVILLDFLLEEVTAFDVIDELKSDPRTRGIPVIVVTSQVLPLEDRERLAAHTEAILSKEHLTRELAINRIRDALRSAGIREQVPGRRAEDE